MFSYQSQLLMVEKQHHTLADRKPELVLLELLWLLNISCLSETGIVSAVLLIKCSNATKNIRATFDAFPY